MKEKIDKKHCLFSSNNTITTPHFNRYLFLSAEKSEKRMCIIALPSNICNFFSRKKISFGPNDYDEIQVIQGHSYAQ